MLRTLSVEQAIQVDSLLGSLGLVLVESVGISWIPTLKRGRDRGDGKSSGGSKGRIELGREASKDRSYTILVSACKILGVRRYWHTIVARYMHRRFNHQQDPLAQQRSSVQWEDKRAKRIDQM